MLGATATGNATYSWTSYESAPEQAGHLTVDILFGPGEDVIFQATNGTTVLGNTGDPSYFGGKSGSGSSK